MFAICIIVTTIQAVLLFEQMLSGLDVPECSCIYQLGCLSVRIKYSDKVYTYSDISKIECNDKSGMLYVIVSLRTNLLC